MTMACRHGASGRPPLLARLRRMRCARLIGVVLLTLALRSLIPVGFMPASDGSLSLILCPHDLPLGLASGHQTQGHGASDDSHCNFCTGFSAAPPSPLLAALLLLLTGIAVLSVVIAAPGGIHAVRLPQARAPPASVRS